MSEIIKRFPGLRLEAVERRDERSVVLPFPQPNNVEQTTELSEDAIPLVKRLCEELSDAGVSYCHWKSNWKLRRWMHGVGDLDLLVATTDANRFNAIAGNLGFAQAARPSSYELPGMQHFFGWDHEAEKFVHLHVYYKLLVGHDLTTNYHLPVEEAMLQSTRMIGPMPVPEPELELIVFVLRKVLATWTLENYVRSLFGRTNDTEKTAAELTYLEVRTNRARVYELLAQTFPGLSITFFEACLNSLRSNVSSWHRTAVRLQLERFMVAHARRHSSLDGLVKTWRFTKKLAGDRLGAKQGRRFANGGLLIAVVGGDGSGKTTAIKGIDNWLSEHFAVNRFHFGKPRRSPITLMVIIGLRAGALLQQAARKSFPKQMEAYDPTYPSLLRMVRWVCAGRDRLRVFVKARRFADTGGIAICDRYSVPGIQLMDGPNIPRATNGVEQRGLRQVLLNAESRSYQHITPPDLLLVLRVDPETAVRRKTTEKEDHVRTRSTEVWQHDWSNTRAHVIDASESADKVLNKLRTEIWSHI